jgi:hypothetical protein
VVQRNVIVLIDDLTGKELSPSEGETLHFSLDGNQYEIDLDVKGAQRLRSLVAPFASAGRRVNRSRGTRPRPIRIKPAPASVRAWAWANGVSVNQRGRLPESVVAQFQAAGN